MAASCVQGRRGALVGARARRERGPGMHVGRPRPRATRARSLLVQYAENVAVGLSGLATFSTGVHRHRRCLVELGALLFEPLREASAATSKESIPARDLDRARDARERAGAIGAAVLAAGLLP